MQPALQRIFHDLERPSRLVLPIVPERSARVAGRLVQA
jgi:hypothetical protein